MEETRSKHEHDEPSESSAHAMTCPICMLMKAVAGTRRKHSAFFEHMMTAQIEVLRAFKSVIDQQITCLEEKRGAAEQGRKATKIPVE